MIKSAPAASFILFALAFAILYVAFNWRYTGQIESLTGQANLLKDQVADYRERLGLAPADKTTYSKLTNQELKDSVSEFVVRLREFASRTDATLPPDLSIEQARAMSKATTEEERAEISQRFWQRQIAMYREQANAKMLEYQQKFRTQAIVLRDEMLRRLPVQPPSKVPVIYDMLVGPTPAYDIAMDLERLSSLLPVRKSRQ